MRLAVQAVAIGTSTASSCGYGGMGVEYRYKNSIITFLHSVDDRRITHVLWISMMMPVSEQRFFHPQDQARFELQDQS